MFYFTFKQFVCLAVWFLIGSHAKKGDDEMSMDEKIFHAATSPEMFGFFHVMPEGDVKVLTELDLLLTLDQYNSLHLPDDEKGRQKRKAVEEEGLPSRQWPNNTVYYEITDTFNDKERAVIKEAIQHWEEYTCLTFEETSSQPNRILFKDGEGCYSRLGMIGGPQDLGLAPGCRTKGVIIHEIGHAIGWIHEHMRPDRDDYIEINFDAIEKMFQPNYYKYYKGVINTHGVSYDYLSVMHYGSDPNKQIILTFDRHYQDKIGQRNGLSFKDIRLANTMYKCPEEEKCQPQRCTSNGFQLLKPHKGEKSCQCWCDSGDIEDPLILCSKLHTPPSSPKPKLRPTSTTIGPDLICHDLRKDCKKLKALGKCMTTMEVMMDTCSKTCNFCGKGKSLCMDHEKNCYLFAKSGLCQRPGFWKIMKTLCSASCGLCTKVSNPSDIQREMTEPLNGGKELAGRLVMTFLVVFVTVIRNAL